MDDKKVIFICKLLSTIRYSHHFHAFEIVFTQEEIHHNFEDLNHTFPTSIHTLKSGMYVAMPKS